MQSTLGYTSLEDSQNSFYAAFSFDTFTDDKEIKQIRKQLFSYKDELLQEESEEELDDESKKIKEQLQQGLQGLKDNIESFITLQSKITQITRNMAALKASVSKIKEGVKDIKFLKLDTINIAIDDIDAKTTQMFEQIESQFNQDIENMSNEKKELQKKIKQASSVYGIAYKLYHTCPICFTNEITHFAGMCGHTYCSVCVAKMRENCFICNKHITSINPLFSC